MKDVKFDESIGVIIKTASKTLERTIESELKKRLGLVGNQWKVLIALSIQDGSTQKEIADKIFVETPTIVPIIDKMDKDGLVKRLTDPQDRRNNMIFLTKKSMPLVESVINFILEFRKAISKNITVKDMDITKKVLHNLVKNAQVFNKNIKKRS